MLYAFLKNITLQNEQIGMKDNKMQNITGASHWQYPTIHLVKAYFIS